MDNIFLDDKWTGDTQYDLLLEEMFLESLIIFEQYGVYDIDFKIGGDIYIGTTCCDEKKIIMITMSTKRDKCKIEDGYGEFYDEQFETFADKWCERIE